MKAVFGILLMMTFALGTSASLAQNSEIDAEIVELAKSGVASNDEWEPYIQAFDGVEMVLVPAGCFKMGSTQGEVDALIAEGVNEASVIAETPVHEQCFDEPFWIDRYEVTNDQYGSTGCVNWSSEPDQPRNCISWSDARDFCESRDARLPTEPEWEYAARGPDNLVFPWGNEWNPDLANWAGTAPDETFAVGSFPDGASWVGALDMSGNVWEWVSSLYQDYPYDGDDGREDLSNNEDRRVLRGGSLRVPTEFLRTAVRGNWSPGYVDGFGGYRCARSF